ncbi:MAG TPA: hypothetical protein VIO61_09205 [Anaerolineaceae bacterium]
MTKGIGHDENYVHGKVTPRDSNVGGSLGVVPSAAARKQSE